MIEAVITCVDYADFLAETLPHNRGQFDQLVVVTAPEDKETRKLCEYWHVKCIPTDVFATRWGQFNKGKAINVGLNALDRGGWLVHMDADIMLPPSFRPLVDTANLDPTCIYGIDRHMVPDSAAWRAFIAQPQLQQEGWAEYGDAGKFIHFADQFPLGTRVAHPSGWVPLGFFQMWHVSASKAGYPEQHTDAARGDMLFSLRWPRSKRHLIPELVAYHLESEPAVMGVNWNGRKTKRFGAL